MSPEAVYYAFVAGLGALFGVQFGSFLNVCIHRLPRRLSLVRPRSRCATCCRVIAWYDNLPVVSYVMLRGRCRHCGVAFGAHYPLVEATTGALWAGAFALLGISVAALAVSLGATLVVGYLIGVTTATRSSS
jgi:leader peptidase (prepilin peptidase) / N-methyltransferase